MDLNKLKKYAETNWHQDGTPDDKSSTVDYPLADFDGESIIIPGTTPAATNPQYVIAAYNRKPEMKVKPLVKKAFDIPETILKHPRALAAAGAGALGAYGAAKQHNKGKALATLTGAGIGAVAGDLIDLRASKMNKQVLTRMDNLEQMIKDIPKTAGIPLQKYIKPTFDKAKKLHELYRNAALVGASKEVSGPLGTADPVTASAVGAIKGIGQQAKQHTKELFMKKKAGIGELVSEVTDSGVFKGLVKKVLENPKTTMAVGGAAIGAAAGSTGGHTGQGALIGAAGGLGAGIMQESAGLKLMKKGEIQKLALNMGALGDFVTKITGRTLTQTGEGVKAMKNMMASDAHSEAAKNYAKAFIDKVKGVPAEAAKTTSTVPTMVTGATKTDKATEAPKYIMDVMKKHPIMVTTGAGIIGANAGALYTEHQMNKNSAWAGAASDFFEKAVGKQPQEVLDYTKKLIRKHPIGTVATVGGTALAASSLMNKQSTVG
jgi:hypothetical protein